MYLLSSTMPRLGQDVAWCENNESVYAYSILGARLEQYADYLDICRALCTFDEQPTSQSPFGCDRTLVTTALPLQDSILYENGENSRNRPLDLDLYLLFTLLGHLFFSLSDRRVPLLLGMQNNRYLQFCAAFWDVCNTLDSHCGCDTRNSRSPKTRSDSVIQLRTRTVSAAVPPSTTRGAITRVGESTVPACAATSSSRATVCLSLLITAAAVIALDTLLLLDPVASSKHQ
jgi:hypothetical protein